jgi:hypothetical protein
MVKKPKMETMSPIISSLPSSPLTMIMDSPLMKLSVPTKEIRTDVTTYEDFLQVFNNIWKEQQKINLVNMRLNCVNLFVNYSNILNTNQLKVKCNQFESDIEDGKKTIGDLQGKVGDQEVVITSLNDKVVDLNGDLVEHKSKLDQACEKYYTTVTELEGTMTWHKDLLKKFEDKALKEDLALDTLISVLSLVVVNTSFVNFPVQLVSSLVTNSKHRNLVHHLTKFLIFLSILISCRNFMIQKGFHGHVGGIVNYVWSFASLFTK